MSTRTEISSYYELKDDDEPSPFYMKFYIYICEDHTFLLFSSENNEFFATGSSTNNDYM